MTLVHLIVVLLPLDRQVHKVGDTSWVSERESGD